MTYRDAVEHMDQISRRERRHAGQRSDGVPKGITEGAMARMKQRRAARGGH